MRKPAVSQGNCPDVFTFILLMKTSQDIMLSPGYLGWALAKAFIYLITCHLTIPMSQFLLGEMMGGVERWHRGQEHLLQRTTVCFSALIASWASLPATPAPVSGALSYLHICGILSQINKINLRSV